MSDERQGDRAGPRHQGDGAQHAGVVGDDLDAGGQRAQAGDDDQTADGDTEDRGRDPGDEPGREWRGQQAADEQGSDEGEVDARCAQSEQEAEAGEGGDEELRGVDRADDRAG